jgi:hypothetical protein
MWNPESTTPNPKPKNQSRIQDSARLDYNSSNKLYHEHANTEVLGTTVATTSTVLKQ